MVPNQDREAWLSRKGLTETEDTMKKRAQSIPWKELRSLIDTYHPEALIYTENLGNLKDGRSFKARCVGYTPRDGLTEFTSTCVQPRRGKRTWIQMYVGAGANTKTASELMSLGWQRNRWGYFER